MGLTAGQLNRATLARQLLLRREPLDVVEGVRRVVALQAQQAASPYVALWNRIEDFDPTALDTAFTDLRVVKATLMRITLHAVHSEDHPFMHTAMQPTLRGARLGDSRFTESGLSAAEAEALVPHLLEFMDRPRRNAEIETWIEDRLGVPPKGVWWALRSFAPVLHAPTGGPWSFGPRPSYIASGTPLATGDEEVADEALARLVLCYLEGFGPASAADVAQFALVRRSRVRKALAALSDVVVEVEGPGGIVLFDIPGAPLPHEDAPAPPRLMAMWDSVLLAYADRGRVIPPDYRRLVTRNNGDVLPTLLVDGYVAGVWRPVDGGIEATAFHRLSAETWDGLAAEASALVKLVDDRDPRVYRRYDNWWKQLSGAEVRVLPGG
jgi:hypothetical protein